MDPSNLSDFERLGTDAARWAVQFINAVPALNMSDTKLCWTWFSYAMQMGERVERARSGPSQTRAEMLDNIRRNLDEVHAEYGSLLGDRFAAVGVDFEKVAAVRAFIIDFRDKLVVEYAELPF